MLPVPIYHDDSATPDKSDSVLQQSLARPQASFQVRAHLRLTDASFQYVLGLIDRVSKDRPVRLIWGVLKAEQAVRALRPAGGVALACSGSELMPFELCGFQYDKHQLMVNGRGVPKPRTTIARKSEELGGKGFDSTASLGFFLIFENSVLPPTKGHGWAANNCRIAILRRA